MSLHNNEDMNNFLLLLIESKSYVIHRNLFLISSSVNPEICVRDRILCQTQEFLRILCQKDEFVIQFLFYHSWKIMAYGTYWMLTSQNSMQDLIESINIICLC